MAGGRIRTIKPELLEDEKVGALTSDQFRLFIGVILLADDHGNFRANTVWLNGQVFWGQTLASPRESVANTRECVRALADVGLIQLYSDGEQQYGHITNWLKHQKIDRPSKPKLPLPTPENIEKKSNVGQPREPSRGCIEPSTQTRDGSGSGSGSGPGGEVEHSRALAGSEALPPVPQKRNRSRKVETTLPENWEPSAGHIELARELGVDLTHCSAQFRDRNRATGQTYRDWDAAFRTWLRNEAKWNKNTPLLRQRGSYPVQTGGGGVSYLRDLRARQEAASAAPVEVVECADV